LGTDQPENRPAVGKPFRRFHLDRLPRQPDFSLIHYPDFRGGGAVAVAPVPESGNGFGWIGRREIGLFPAAQHVETPGTGIPAEVSLRLVREDGHAVGIGGAEDRASPLWLGNSDTIYRATVLRDDFG